MKQQVLKNILSNYAVSLLGIILGFMLVPFLIRKLGTEAYGLIALVDSTILFFEVATVGVRTALARHATYALSQGKEDDFRDILSTGRYVLLGSSVVVCALGAVISYFFPYIFKVPPDLFLQSRLLFLLVVASFTISIPNIVFWSVLYSRQRYDLINFSMSFGTLTRALAIFILFTFLPRSYVNLAAYGAIFILFTWAQNWMIYRYHRKVMPSLSISHRYFKRAHVRDILSFSAYTSLQRLSGMLVGNMTNILLNIFYGPAANALYSVATKIPTMLRRVFTEATWSLTPTFTDLAARNDRDRLQKLFFMYTKVLIIGTAPVCFLLILFAEPIIRHWVGPDFAVSGSLAVLYTAPLLLGIPFAVCGCINNAFGKVKVPSQVGIFYSVFNVLFGILLAKGFHMEIYGFAVSNILSAFAFLILFQPTYACRTSGIPLGGYLLGAVLRPFAPSILVFAAAAYLLHGASDAWSLGRIMALSLPLSAAAWVGGLFIGLARDERSMLLDLVRRRR